MRAATPIEQAIREHVANVAVALVRLTGDFAAAEDLAQDAVVAALRTWPVSGMPDRPGAWLYAVARNRALDQIRRDRVLRDKLALIGEPTPVDESDRLELIFTCCHPALARPAQIALTLRVVCGLSTEQIGRALLVADSAIEQRITRAKRKIRKAAIPYRVPTGEELATRLNEVLAVIYLLFNEGYSPTRSASVRDLTEDAEWLAALLHTLMPSEPEVVGLLALIRLQRARACSRYDADGAVVLLEAQDRSAWDRTGISQAVALLRAAGRHRRPGVYQLQAAIVACHADAADFAATDWEQILVLYDMLVAIDPSPVHQLQRSIALRYTAGPAVALRAIDDVIGALDNYSIAHATRAEMLRASGRSTEAMAADRRAYDLTANPAQRAILASRLDWG